jgi:hypothetical protein
MELKLGLLARDMEIHRMNARLKSQRELLNMMQEQTLMGVDVPLHCHGTGRSSHITRHAYHPHPPLDSHPPCSDTPPTDDQEEPLIIAAARGDTYSVSRILATRAAWGKTTRVASSTMQPTSVASSSTMQPTSVASSTMQPTSAMQPTSTMRDEVATALLWACQCGHSDTAMVLLDEWHADVHVDYDSPLLWACTRGDHDMARMLLDRGADVCALDMCAVRIAASHRDTAMLKLLMRIPSSSSMD